MIRELDHSLIVLPCTQQATLKLPNGFPIAKPSTECMLNQYRNS